MSARPSAQPPRRPVRHLRSARPALPHVWGDPDPTPTEPVAALGGDVGPQASTEDGAGNRGHTLTWGEVTRAHILTREGADTGAYAPAGGERTGAYAPAGGERTGAYAPAADDDDTVDVTVDLTAGAGRHARLTRQELAPWAHRRREPAGPGTIVTPKAGPAPVFVDDSGRRRRAGRLVGATVVVAVAAYTAVIALTLAGVPLVGRVAPPGIERLARPAGDTRVVTGPAAEEVQLPPPPETVGTTATSETSDSTASSSRTSGADTTTASTGSTSATTSATTTTASTTTTTAPAHGPTTTLTSPGTTSPGRGNGSGRPPAPPGQG